MLTGEGVAQQQQQQQQQQQHHREPFRVGEVVERDIDGVWFPAKVVAVHEKKDEAVPSGGSGSIGRRRQLAYDLFYLDDNNRESEVPEEDIRVVYDYGTKTKESMLLLLGTEHERGGDSTAARGHSHGGGDSKSLDARQYVEAGANSRSRGQDGGKDGGVHDEDGDGHAGPKVTIHSSLGTFDTKEDGSATAYIINGPETNVAAGSGLRGIRWLRGP
ncbi:unnamed protein product [Ectocarpus sp. CCAP 1310/34]|nr:unnamed protein product [Ectocarpus sp. CCAP 1310/34]